MFNLFSLPQFGQTRIVVWYQTEEARKDASGLGVTRTQDNPHVKLVLDKTHKPICEFFMDDHNSPKILDYVFAWMQKSVWSPDGSSDHVALDAGVSHISMSSGDVAQIGDRFFVRERNGFEEITQLITLVELKTAQTKLENAQ